MHCACRDLAGEAAEVLMGAENALNGKTKSSICALNGEGYGLKQFEEAGAVVPRRSCAAVDDVVAFECADRDGDEFWNLELNSKREEVAAMGLEDFFGEVYDIHFVYSGDDCRNAEQSGDASVAAGLIEDAF